MERGGSVNFELWVCGFMFTAGLITDDFDRWWYYPIVMIGWPIYLGVFIRKEVLKL